MVQEKTRKEKKSSKHRSMVFTVVIAIIISKFTLIPQLYITASHQPTVSYIISLLSTSSTEQRKLEEKNEIRKLRQLARTSVS